MPPFEQPQAQEMPPSGEAIPAESGVRLREERMEGPDSERQTALSERYPQQEPVFQGTEAEKRAAIQRMVEEADATPKGVNIEVLGTGAEHVVLRYEDAKKVIKVNHRLSLDTAHNLYSTEGRTALREELEEARIARAKERRRLRHYFGSALLSEVSMVEDVPISASLYNQFKPRSKKGKEVGPGEKIPALVVVQTHFEADPENKIDLTESYAEADASKRREYVEVSDAEYDRGHDLLVGKPHQPNKQNATPDEIQREQVRVAETMYPSLRKVVQRQQEDEQFRECFRNFARNLVRYANETHPKEEGGPKEASQDRIRNPILDFVGKENIVIAPGNKGRWRPLLLDAIHPDPTDTIEALEEVTPEIRRGLRKDARARNVALNVLHYIRFANALAITAGIQERVQVPEEIQDLPAWRWREFIDWDDKSLKGAALAEAQEQLRETVAQAEPEQRSDEYTAVSPRKRKPLVLPTAQHKPSARATQPPPN